MFHIQKDISILVVILSIALVVPSVVTANDTSMNTQVLETATPTPTGASPFNVVFTLQDNALQSADLTTHQKRNLSTLDVKTLGSDVSQIVLDQTNNVLYVVANMGQFNNPLKAQGPNPMRIVRISMVDGKKDIVFERSNLDKVIPSPDGQNFLVTYYEGDLGKSRLLLCIFNVQTRKCADYNNKRLASDNVHWINNQSFAILEMSDRSIQIVDSLTLTEKRLMGLDDWFILTVTPIPATHLLLVGAKSRKPSDSHPLQLFTLDWDTSQIQVLSFAILGDRFKDYYGLEFSPNGKLFFYNSDEKLYMVEFPNGKLIATIDKVSQAQWLPDSRTFVVNTYDRSEGSSITDIVDAQTGKITSSTKNAPHVPVIIARTIPKLP